MKKKIQEWYENAKHQHGNASLKFEIDHAALIAELKRQEATMNDFEDVVDDLVDEIILSVRKEHTNFDNSWLPLYEFELDAPS